MTLTPKQEAFARAYVETGNASEAYRQAYTVKDSTKPDTVWANASRVLAISKVAARVAELQLQAVERTMVTVESLTLELDNAINHALKDPKGASAAVSAIMGKAKLHGLLIDKNEHTGKDGAPIEVAKIERVIVRSTNRDAGEV